MNDHATMQTQKRIFILGDSRTGTLTLHKFFLQLGFQSKHYFVEEANQVDPDFEHHQENWDELKRYIGESELNAFSDYPTRLFEAELLEEYPDAFFILSTRRTVGVWQQSMARYFSNLEVKIDLSELTKGYVEGNERIRRRYRGAGVRFLEVCIDDGVDNSELIKTFLETDSEAQIGWEDSETALESSLYSKREELFGVTDGDPISHVERVIGQSKAMLSEYGWIYLVNDTNDFLRYQFGGRFWTSEEKERAQQVLVRRNEAVAALGSRYLKFIVPEKSAVYPEYLPRCFESLDTVEKMPAEELANDSPEIVHYLRDYLIDLKSHGALYFKGDTHTNWLGSHFVYLRIAEVLNRTLKSTDKRRDPIRLDSMVPSLAGYDGDLYVQLGAEFKATLSSESRGAWMNLQNPGLFESLIRYQLPESARRSRQVDVPGVYQKAFTQRETFVFEAPESGLPRAVIFRDSTCDHCLELLAEHFSRCVFIWHEGLVYEDVIRRESPDIVIHIMAERFVARYPEALDLMRVDIETR